MTDEPKERKQRRSSERSNTLRAGKVRRGSARLPATSVLQTTTARQRNHRRPHGSRFSSRKWRNPALCGGGDGLRRSRRGGEVGRAARRRKGRKVTCVADKQRPLPFSLASRCVRRAHMSPCGTGLASGSRTHFRDAPDRRRVWGTRLGASQCPACSKRFGGSFGARDWRCSKCLNVEIILRVENGQFLSLFRGEKLSQRLEPSNPHF